MCRRGARISVWNDDTGESDILIVHECDIFSIGDQDFPGDQSEAQSFAKKYAGIKQRLHPDLLTVPKS